MLKTGFKALKLSSKEMMILAVSTLLIVFIVVGAYINDRNFRLKTLSQSKKQIEEVSIGLASLIEKQLKGVYNSLKVLATIVAYEGKTLDQVKEYLRISHKTVSPYISSLGYLDRNGRLRISFPDEAISRQKIDEYKSSPLIKKALATGKAIVFHGKQGKLKVRLIVPVYHHRPLGLLVAKIDINKLLTENVSYFSLKEKKNHQVFLSGSDGEVIVFPDVLTHRSYKGGNLRNMPETCGKCHEKDDFEDVGQAAETKTKTVTRIYIDQNGENDLRVSVPIELPQNLWILSTCVSMDEAFQTISIHQRQAWGLAAGLGIVLFGGNIFLFAARKRQAELENEARFLRREEELTKQSRKTLAALMKGTASVTGTDFFDALLKNICKLEDMDYGLICRLGPPLRPIKKAWILSIWDNGEVEKNYEKDLSGSPCEKTVTAGFSCYTENAGTLFPDTEMMKNPGFQSYIGIPLKSGEGEVIGVLCVFHSRSITLKPHTEEVFQILSQRAVAEIHRLDAVEVAMKSQEQLLQAQKMESIGTLAGGIAHDFNNLLAGIMGSTSLLKINLNPKDALYQYVNAIDKSSQKASDLVRKLLGFGRRGKMRIEVFDLNAILEETMILLESSVTRSVVIDWQPSCYPLPAEGDPDQIEQVVLNLCFNARDAMGKSGILKVVSRPVTLTEKDCNHQDLPPGKYVSFMISDTGCGMDEETVKRIYEPFFTTKPKYKGTGLGLAMVYGIIRNHQGFIYVKSQLDSGTSFEIFLKRSPKPISSTVEEDFKLSAENKKQTILLVDDEETVLEITGMILTETGYRVIQARDGIEAVETYREKRKEIDLVLMDHYMPGMAGKEAARKMFEMDKSVKVIINSGYAEDGLYRAEDGKIIAGFLKKPYHRLNLLKKIEEVLDET